MNSLYQHLLCPHSENTAYLDSAASDNFGNKRTPLNNITPLKHATPMHLTNGQSMKPTHAGALQNLPSMSNINKQCQICPDQKGPALLFIGKFCEDRCIAIADNKKCIIYEEKPIIKALRCPTTSMHVANLTNPLLQKACNGSFQ